MALVIIAIFSFWLRIWDLARPKGLVFDELYYVKEAKALLRYGVETNGSSPEFIVHPPVGKWCIALGIKLFGESEFGWRIASAFVGAFMIYLIGRIATHLFDSQSLGTLAGLLMALDGLQLVHSRTALLDLFLTFFLLLAIYAWLKERYWLAGLLFGLAIGTKWSAIYFLAAFAATLIYRDFIAGRELGISSLTKKAAERLLQFFFLPVGIYVASWSGWFLSSKGWDRNWAQKSPSSWNFIPAPLRSLWHYHAEMWHFHTTLTTHHAYQANPWSWLVMGRPTSFFYASPSSCGAKQCAQEVLALGTPLLWWMGTLAIAIVFGYWVSSIVKGGSDKVAGFILLGIAAGYLPWFFLQRRTVFTFYAIVFEPFLICALVYVAKKYLGEKPWQRNKRIIVLLFILIIALNFIYFLPIYKGSIISYSSWSQRMWLPSWI